MKLLLDECMPRRLRRDLLGHTVSTVEDAGFKGLKNGRLLRAAAGRFDILLTVDKSIPVQQNLVGLQIALLVVRAYSNKYKALQPLTPQILSALQTIQPGEIVIINALS